MLRDKDKKLAAECARIAKASSEMIQWLEVPANRDAVGQKHGEMIEKCRRGVVEANKLSRAATRPMSATVFGGSQAGKSYMIGSFLSPEDRPTRLVFEDGGKKQSFDFLESINPQGGDETTGIVTRFSTSPVKGGPAGFPVVLRALREIDVVKILANTHNHELERVWEQGSTPDAERLATMIQGLPRLPTGAQGVEVEQIYELRDYMRSRLPHHPMAADAAEPYWRALERFAPSLGAPQRVAAFAPLWGELAEFSDLFLTLKTALDNLRHPTWMYVPLEAILDTSYGVLHAATLYGLDPAHAAKLDGDARRRLTPTTVATDGGTRFELPRPIVTALAAELRATLDQRPWEFLQHTDLLDFPGAKTRDPQKRDYISNHTKDNARAFCYLRGKVAVLFDTYVDDLEVNALVFAIDNGPQEVTGLASLVQDWVNRSHGKTPAERAAVSPVSLFFTPTKCDTLFLQTAKSLPGDAVRLRLTTNFSKFHGWIENWAPGAAFDNVFLFRNVRVEQAHMIRYDGPWPADPPPTETGYQPDFEARRPAFREAYLNEKLVQRHIADAGAKFDAMLTLRDGGLSYLAKALAPVCDMDLKVRQIEPARKRLHEEIRTVLYEFHEAPDVAKRILERLDGVNRAYDALAENNELFGPLIRQFQVQAGACRQQYLDHVRMRGPQAGRQRGSVFGTYAVAKWKEAMMENAKDEQLARSFRLSPDQYALIVNELVGFSTRSGLEGQINNAVTEIERTPRTPAEMAYRVGMSAARYINACAGELGAAPAPRSVTAPDYPNLPEDVNALHALRDGFFNRWFDSLRRVTADNARDGQGGRIAADQNARLGGIIALIEEP